MRREYKGQSYVDWLKSLGCVMYLPLSDGDLQDKISGEYLQLTGNGSMVWDSTEQMYKVTLPYSAYQYVAKLTNGLDNDSFPDDNFTTLHQVKKITNSSTKYLVTLSPQSADSDTCASTSAMYNGTGCTNAWPANLANVAYVSNNDRRNRSSYQNGELYNTYAEYLPYLPSNWVMNGTGFTIGCCRGVSGYSGVQFYMKEIYLFNTALDLNTIRKIQGYE